MTVFPRWATMALLVSNCAALNTELAIVEKPLPTTFDPDAGSEPSSAQVNWRDWLADAQLESLVTEAIANNQDLLIALQRIELTRAGVLSATGALLPQVSLGVGAGVRKFGLYTMDGAGNASTEITPGQLVPQNLGDFLVGLQASWELDIWGKLRNQRESAVAQYLASVEGTNLVLSSLIGDVASGYFELLSLDQTLDVLQRSVTRQTEALEVIRLQMSAGRANELAVLQFEAELTRTQAQAREVRQQLLETENRLNVLLGRFPQPISRTQNALSVDNTAKISSGVPSELLQNRPDIRQAELDLRASKFDVKAARAAFFPNLNLSAGIGFQAFNPAFLLQTPESLAYSVLGGLVAPLVNFTGLQAQFRGAKANQLQAMYAYQRSILIGFTEVANALTQVRTTDELVALKKARKASLEQAIETATLLYRAGKVGYLDVLTAQQSALQSELEFIESWKQRRVAQVAVYKALGGGWK
jgi:multidrug efflux system outer membrane protein